MSARTELEERARTLADAAEGEIGRTDPNVWGCTQEEYEARVRAQMRALGVELILRSGR